MTRRRGNPRITAFRAGLIAIVVTAIAVYLVFGGSLPFQGGFELKAVVTSASELHSRTPVRIAGVEVGKVEDVKRPGRSRP